MATMLNDGYCPECLLIDENVNLLLNKDDFWECPKSNLQLAVYGKDAVVLKFRGISKFKDEPVLGTHQIDGAILTQAEGNSIISARTVFNSQQELKSYLANEVEPYLELSLPNLADTYAQYINGTASQMPYKRQSNYFKIDFESQGIIQKLEKRDLAEGMASSRSYTHLYSLLKHLFYKYNNGDISWLPEMGMSLNQLELCNKHLHNAPEPVTHVADKDVIRQRLLIFMVDLIEIVYFGKGLNSNESGSQTVKPDVSLMLTLQDVVNLKTELFKNSRVKLVRHKDNRKEYRELIKDKTKLLEYQRKQSKEVFKGCDYIISFIGQKSTKSLLFGIFKVNGVQTREDYFYYDLEQIHELDYLIDRVVVDWGDNALAWHQWYHKQPKEIVQILPKGYLGSFPGLLNFTLDFDELQKLIQNPDANQDWMNHLSAINGIYLILDTKTGDQYIGSAYGTEGIWHRWQTYVKSYHGGNIRLIERCEVEPGYHRNFRFSILQTLPSNMSKNEVIAIESLYKQKLGTRVYGLNSN